MKLTKNIESYVKARVNEFITSIDIAEEKLEKDCCEKIQSYEKVLKKELDIELPKIIATLCKENHIDTKMYTVNVRGIDVYVHKTHTIPSLKEKMNISNSLYTKILVKLELEKSSNMETIDYIIDSILYPEPEAKKTMGGGEDDEPNTVSNNNEADS